MNTKLCECGCGQPAPLSTTINPQNGYVKGQPLRFVKGHGVRGRRHPQWKSGQTQTVNGYKTVTVFGHVRAKDSRYVREHLIVAEKALGRPIPKQCPVHHVDFNKQNNSPSNLVICENQEYHYLLHVRTLALKSCGHVDWRTCRYCKQYDSPESMYVSPNGKIHYHSACVNAYKNALRKRHRVIHA